MSEKAQATVDELVSACIAFGRQVEPDWQTRIEDARVALREYIEGLEHDLSNKEIEYTDLWGDMLALQERIAELEGELDRRIRMPKDLWFQVAELSTRVNELKAAQRWIPVSERLPEIETDRVLIRRGNIVALGWVYFDELMGDWDWRCYDEDWDGNPTHWMLLPKLSEVQE